MIITLDGKRKTQKSKGHRVNTRGAEAKYTSALKKVADQVGLIVSPFDPVDPGSVSAIDRMLKAYADMLRQWATMTASNMLMDVALRDERTWKTVARDMGLSLRDEIRASPTGDVMRMLLADQVDLIQSLPRQAAERVHRMTLAGMEKGLRADEIAAEIQKTGSVTKSRAILIAQTEVSRSATTLTQARAQHIGSPGYFWRTSEDGAVREDHRELNGKFFTWDNPPVADKRTDETAHPGCIYRCRCWADPVIPD